MNKPAVEYSPEVAQAVCLRVAEFGSLKKSLDAPDMPNRSTVYEWLRTRPGFDAMYRAAREEYADAEFDELEALMNEEPPKDDRGNVDHGWVARQKIRINTKQWILARLSPKKYSERVEITGAEGQPVMGDQLTPERLLEGARKMAFVLARADHMTRREPPAPLQLVHEVKSEA